MAEAEQFVFFTSREEDHLPGPERLPRPDLHQQSRPSNKMSPGASAAFRELWIFRLHGRAQTGDEDWEEQGM